ncbi:MAG TPA: hypothetical protein VME46_08500 [Acidimicrobiales bacterium]|nr:hypothetical protein [Acidimicrobiales bacterium]
MSIESVMAVGGLGSGGGSTSIETIAVVVGIMAYSIARQIVGEPLRVKRLLGLPAVLTVIGIVDVSSSKGRAPTGTDVALIAAGCAVNVLIGLGQGRLMRLSSRDGYLWGRMPRSVLWWWGAKVASGLVLDGIGHALGAGLATTSAVMLLRLGVNRLAQAAVVAPRALATGMPFAPEPTKGNTGANGRDDRSPSAKAGLLAAVRDVNSSVFDGGGGGVGTYSPPLRKPRTSPVPHDPSWPTAGSPGTFDQRSAPRASSGPGLGRQLTQVLLRELNNRINNG